MKLKRSIGRITLLFLGINAVIGTEIFFVPALAAAIAGPASILSWLIFSVIAILMSCYFAELVSMFPKSGGVYEYVKRSFGAFPSFIIGWAAWILASISIAMFITGALRYLFPHSHPLFHIVLSLAFIIFFNYISYRGINYSAILLLIFGLMTASSLLILIIPGIPLIDINNYYPMMFSLPAAFLAMFFISQTFFGWDSITYLAEEVKNAKRVMPKFLVLITIIVAVLSIGVVLVSFGVADWKTFSMQGAPLSYIASRLFGDSFGKIFSIFIFVPMIGTVAAWIVASPRLLFAMSRDKAIVPGFQKLHKKYRTPYNAILFQAIATSIITVVALGNYETLISLSVPLCIMVYTPILLAVVKLRISKPETKRYFKAPFGKIGPIVIILFNFIILGIWLQNVSGAVSLFIMNLLFISFGIPLYILIKLQTDNKFVEKFFDKVSWIHNIAFPVWYGKKELRKVLNKIKLEKGAILDFGCGSGFTTLELAKRYKWNARIIAIDLSEVQLERAADKIEKAMKLSNVIFIKLSQLEFEGKSFDAVTAVGVLEHLDNPEKTLKNLFGFLKPGGYFSFLSFGKSFGIPAPEFLSNEEEITNLFKKLGMIVNIRKEKKRLAEYWYIWGRKKR